MTWTWREFVSDPIMSDLQGMYEAIFRVLKPEMRRAPSPSDQETAAVLKHIKDWCTGQVVAKCREQVLVALGARQSGGP